jgi:hypothetical protein
MRSAQDVHHISERRLKGHAFAFTKTKQQQIQELGHHRAMIGIYADETMKGWDKATTGM